MCEQCEWVDALQEKWSDVLDTSDDLTEKTLVTEFLDDLAEAKRRG